VPFDQYYVISANSLTLGEKNAACKICAATGTLATVNKGRPAPLTRGGLRR
jgi:hypothetical protein